MNLQNFFNFIHLDAAPKNSLYFQEESSISMIGIRDLHDSLMFYIIIILILVTYFIFFNILQKNLFVRVKEFIHNTTLEIIWTILPALILLIIAIPTFKLIYNIDEVIKPLVTLKVIGNQWFWNYEINDTIGINVDFSSYPLTDVKEGQLRLLETDQRVLLPILTPIRLLFTSNDVMHSWAVPSLGIKMDCIPGRINHSSLYILRKGVYYGQCSELCGLAHFNMPIVIEAVNTSDYIRWLLSFSDLNFENLKSLTSIFKNIEETSESLDNTVSNNFDLNKRVNLFNKAFDKIS